MRRQGRSTRRKEITRINRGVTEGAEDDPSKSRDRQLLKLSSDASDWRGGPHGGSEEVSESGEQKTFNIITLSRLMGLSIYAKGECY